MKPHHIMAFVGVSLLVTVQPVLANQPPGPNVLFAEILILPVMIVCSIIGGAYAVMRYGKARRRQWEKVVAAIIIIFLSGIHEGYGFLVALLFGMIALARSFRMLAWGIRVRFASTRPAHLQEARAWRLVSAGLLLALSTVFLAGMALAFVGYWPERRDTRRVQQLKEFLIYQLASTQGKKAGISAPAADRLTPDESQAVLNDFFGETQHIRFESDDEGQHFTIYMLPVSRFPFFPYNYLTSQPSYRADDTGQIRMARVHAKEALCPVDAPVVWQVQSLFDTLMVALQDRDGQTRLRAVHSLGQLRDQRAVEPLIAVLLTALQDGKEWRVVHGAITSLGTLQDPRAVAPLVAILQDQRNHHGLRIQVIRTLVELGDPAVMPPLISALQDSESLVQHEAARGLHALKDMRVIEPLIALLQHGEPNVRKEALWVLQSLASLAQTKFGISYPAARTQLQRQLGEDPVKWQQWWEKNH